MILNNSPVFRVPVFRCSGVPGFTNSQKLIIQEENTKKNRVVSLYVIKNHVNLHKL